MILIFLKVYTRNLIHKAKSEKNNVYLRLYYLKKEVIDDLIEFPKILI